jgi:hypothetical protein
MMHVVKIAQSVKRPGMALVLIAVAGLGLVGCNYEGGDSKVQIGANPQLPKLQQYLIPPIQIARVVGWGKETPTVPQGLQVHALATGHVNYAGKPSRRLHHRRVDQHRADGAGPATRDEPDSDG